MNLRAIRQPTGSQVWNKPLIILSLCLAGLLGAPRVAAQQPPDWQAQIRQRVAQHQLAEALAITNDRLAAAPQDLEARGWRARLLA